MQYLGIIGFLDLIDSAKNHDRENNQ